MRRTAACTTMRRTDPDAIRRVEQVLDIECGFFGLAARTPARMLGSEHEATSVGAMPWPGHDRSAMFHLGQQLATEIGGHGVDRAHHGRKFLPRRVQLIDQGYNDTQGRVVQIEVLR